MYLTQGLILITQVSHPEPACASLNICFSLYKKEKKRKRKCLFLICTSLSPTAAAPALSCTGTLVDSKTCLCCVLHGCLVSV